MQIRPHEGLVSIRRDALMDMLEQAEVEVDNLTHIHGSTTPKFK